MDAQINNDDHNLDILVDAVWLMSKAHAERVLSFQSKVS